MTIKQSLPSKFIQLLLITSLLFSVIILPDFAGEQLTVSAETTLSALQEEQEEIKKKQAETKTLLKNLAADKTKQLEYKQTLDTQLSHIQGEVTIISNRIAVINEQIRQKQSEISEKQAEIEKQFDQLKQHLRAIYMVGETTVLESMLAAKSRTELIENTEVAKRITAYDKKLIDGLKGAIQEIKAQKNEIEASKQAVTLQKEAVTAKKAEVDDLLSKSIAVIRELDTDLHHADEESQALERAHAETDAAVDAWFASYYQSQSTPNTQTPVVTSNGTGFVWPVPGNPGISAYWGDGRGHKGIDIAGPGVYGKPIVATKSGRVIKAVTGGWGGGYGLSVFIDHGDSYSSTYAHMSSVAVSTGSVVNAGQIIGYVGNTGQSTGPHLHFEIRQNGVAVNPLPYIS